MAEGQQVAKSFTIRWNGGLWFGGCIRRGPDIVDAMGCDTVVVGASKNSIDGTQVSQKIALEHVVTTDCEG